jgi:hypothetical protein
MFFILHHLGHEQINDASFSVKLGRPEIDCRLRTSTCHGLDNHPPTKHHRHIRHDYPYRLYRA